MESKNTSITTQVSAPAEIVECLSLLNQIRDKVQSHYKNTEDSFKPSIEDECGNINDNLSAIALDLTEIIKEHLANDLYFEHSKVYFGQSKANNQQ